MRRRIFDVERLDRRIEQHLDKSRRSQRADADLETVRDGCAVVFEVFHIPKVAELVFGARRGAARLRGLHRETAQQQTFGQLFDLGNIAGTHACGVAEGVLQPVLHHRKGEFVEQFGAYRIGEHPIGPAGIFAIRSAYPDADIFAGAAAAIVGSSTMPSGAGQSKVCLLPSLVIEAP